MRTIYVEKQLPKMIAVKALRPLWKGAIWSPLSPVRVQMDAPDPPLPGGRWLRVRNRMAGICSTDLSLLLVQAEPQIAPAALPGNQRFYLGHEVVGEVVEVGPKVERFQVGDRVVMESRFAGPNCHTQEIEPPCPFCAQGQERLCENASLGLGPAGQGGGWGDGYTAHETEIWPVPPDLDDERAIFIEPLSVALHGVLRRPPGPGDHALIIGAGTIGLLSGYAIKALFPQTHLTILARHDHQAAAARALGADRVLQGGDLYAELARLTGAKHYTFPLNRGMLLGGFEVVYDCVGSPATVTDALRWARAGGSVVMLGFTLGLTKVDLNPIWYQEVDLVGSHTFGMERWQGRDVHTFDLAIELLRGGRVDPRPLITHRFPFEQYRRAIATALHKRGGSIKVVFTYA
jgi:threonine dehydrogenase-like Zn-dependent dehydrogenase